MTVAHLGDSSSFISNKPSHSSVGPASQQLPSQVRYGLQFFQGPGRRTTITPITQRGKLRHRKTQYRCVESGFKSRPATVSRKKSHCPSQACLCCWVGDPSSVLLSQPQGTPHTSNCRPHSGTVMRDGRDLAGPLGPCIHPVIHHIPASWRLASQRPRSLEALQAPYACLGSLREARACLQFLEDFWGLQCPMVSPLHRALSVLTSWTQERHSALPHPLEFFHMNPRLPQGTHEKRSLTGLGV